MQERIAIIDLGTNTFHLLIAEKVKEQYTFIYRERLAVRLGQRGINEGIIQPDAIERAVRALASFKTTIDQYDTMAIFAFGTSALRNAKNASEVVKTFKEKAGIDINIISGDREAELIFMGVRSGLALGRDYSLVMDIGGGSVEFIIGNEKEIVWKQSFEIGAQRLLEMFHRTDPIDQNEIDQLNQYFASQLPALFDALNQWKPKTLVGSSGTFDTLSDIHCIKHDLNSSVEDIETPLSIQGFNDIYEELLIKNREDRMMIPGMIEMRVDMIVVACCLINFLLDKYTFKQIRVSTYALKEGILASLK
ncbi:phosphatase [Chryseotalea sanaruensis]|uniref:Phosphatase n=1 Tax=Chryseotalea sanaruensis TaxID=2482724 RepID=A0A401UBP6_9BACT|nr:exopolyphosphatase [Chryseotalea sanaruensis]GCC52317.1 phosphatase [Chryseotalea sanaruensis]